MEAGSEGRRRHLHTLSLEELRKRAESISTLDTEKIVRLVELAYKSGHHDGWYDENKEKEKE